jgi:TonB family protein
MIPLLLFCFLAVQDLPPVSAASDYARLHDGVNPPKLLHSFDPEYTPQALAAGIEGSVVLQAVIDQKGNVAYASVLSPLPAGLDAKALAVVKRWKYTPGVMDGELIPVLTTIDVLFQPPYKPPDPLAERQRRAYQEIMNRLAAGNRTPTANDVKEMKDLAGHALVPALRTLGEWFLNGVGVPKNVPAGLEKLKEAAAHDDARALYVLGQTTHDEKLLERAAFLGSAEAQIALAEKQNSAHYFRLCAATGHALCEYRLGKLLVTGPNTNPDDFSQGVAWLELAKEHGDHAAAELYAASFAKLSSLQVGWVALLKPHLELRNFHGF